MNKQKSFDHKKKLVRNTAEKVSNAIVQDQHSVKKIHTETKQIESKSEKTTDEKLFELPRLYSSLRLSKKIDEVNSQKPKSTVDSKKDLAIDEKVRFLIIVCIIKQLNIIISGVKESEFFP